MALNLYKCNYLKELEEEIALEGLDGITIDALWMRLLDRPSCSIRPTSDQTKSFLWKAVVRMENVRIYRLPAPRPPIFIFNRQELVDASGHFLEPVIPANCYAYPHYAIESPNGEMGSCPLYAQRKDISSKARKANLETALSKWGSKLVIVADQKTRMAALSEPEYNLQGDINVKQYCFLERVGRSRQHGEITQGKTGLQNITEDSKTLFYYKKFLSRKKLIKQQLFYVKTPDSSRSGLIIHLPRYTMLIKPKNISDSEKLASFIRTEGSDNVIFHKSVMLKFAEHIEIKKLIMRESKRFRTEMVPYRTMFPDATPEEYKVKNGTGEKTVRIIRLLEEPIDDEEGEEDGDGGDGFLHFEFRTLGLSYIRQAYQVIEAAGPRGIRQNDLGRILGVTGLHSRGLLKHMTKKGYICTASADKGRQRAIHYYSRKFENSMQTLSAELEHEMSKLMKMVAPPDPDEPPAKKLKVEKEKGASFFKNMNLLREVPEVSRPSKEEMDAVGINISMSDVRTPSSNFNSLFATFGEGSSSGTPDKAQNASVTARMVKRAHLILKAVNTHKVIYDPQKLQRMINEEEAAEGHKHVVDRRTITRILDKLVNDGYVRIIKVKISGHGKEKTLHFIVHPSVDSENSEIRSAIEQAKMKLPIITRELMRKEEKAQRKSLGYIGPLTAFNLGKYDSRAGRKYGLKPKFVKKQVLHSFMFYLVYEHKGKQAATKEIQTLLKNKTVDLSLMDELSPVYSTTGDWKTFLPPLPQHKGYTKGWCLVSDLLLRLPLVLFVAMVNTPYEIPGLQDYLSHPIKKYYLVRNLPSNIASSLTLHRKYIFTITELITKLAFMGLIQIGPQTLKEKDQYFVYVNRHAMLLDTTPSSSGYNHISKEMSYETMKYSLKCLPDVEQYWYDLWNFAMNTNLGCRNVMSGKPVVIESVITKKILLDSIKPRGIDEAKKLDVGYLPGDRLGAAGLDSDLFVHLKRNWYWTADNRLPTQSNKVLEPRKPSTKRTPARKRALSKSASTPTGVIKKIRLVAPANQNKHPPKEPEHEETTNDVPDTEPETTQDVMNEDSNMAAPDLIVEREEMEVEPLDRAVPPSRAKHKKITRYFKPRDNKPIRKPYYDQIDREALRRMVKLRVDWSSTEDNLLLICKVASLYMSADTKRYVAKNFAVVREILHSTCPLLGQNKTSRACQRRMCYMMKNPSTTHSVYLCLEEIKQDPEITDKFGMAVEKMDRLIKSQGKGPKCCQAEYDKIYTDLVLCLLGKLKTITTPEEATLEKGSIPDSVEEFVKRYSIVVPKNLNLRYGSYSEVQNTVDIMCSVVNVIIHSSLCCSNDKTSYSYQLFFVYQQYPDKLLRSVMARCRSMQIVSCRKRYKRWKTANSGCLPLSSSPYQLSITYINILQTRYQYSIFHESRTSLNSLFSKMAYQLQAASILPSSSAQHDMSSLADIQVTSGGECANIVELFSCGLLSIEVQFPSHLIILDPRLSEKEESYTLIMKRFKEMLSVINSKNKVPEEVDEENDEDEDANKTPAVGEETLQSDFNLSNKAGVANTASRLALYMMRDEPVEYLDKSLQHAHDYFVLKPCKIKVELDEDKIKESVMFDEKQSNIISDIKRLAVFPDETTDNDEILGKLTAGFEENVMKSLLEFLESKKELGALYKDILANVEGCDQDINSCLDVLISEQFILKSGNVHVRFVHNKFRKPWLVRSYFIPRTQREHMSGLRNNTNAAYALQLRGDSDEEPAPSPKPAGEIEKMDITEAADEDKPQTSCEAEGTEKTEKSNEPVVMVLRHKKRRWASLKESKFGKFDFSALEPVKVNMRPWIRVDGTLNRKVLDRLLGSVLGHCLAAPSILLKNLQNRFTPALQPVHTYDLVLILHKIKAVELVVLKKSGRPSLISKRQTVTEVPAGGYEDAELVSVHPQLLAVTRFGQFLSERHLNIDYLDALTDFKLLSHSGS